MTKLLPTSFSSEKDPENEVALVSLNRIIKYKRNGNSVILKHATSKFHLSNLGFKVVFFKEFATHFFGGGGKFIVIVYTAVFD